MISKIAFFIGVAALSTSLTVSAQTAATTKLDPGFLKLKYVTVLVRDYDEALSWYTGVLGWRKVEDRAFGPGQRWVVVAPQGENNVGIVLDRPASGGSDDAMKNYTDRIGKETNWVFQVADCGRLFDVLSKRGVKFIEPPKLQPWGTSQAIFQDLYGNVFVVEGSAPSSPH